MKDGAIERDRDRATAPDRRSALRRVVIDLSIMTVIGILMALVGPFGTFADPLPLRLVSWLAFAWIGYAIYAPMGFFVDRAARALDLPEGPLWVVAAVLATVPMSATVWVVGHLPAPIPVPTLEQAMVQYFYVLVIGGGTTALFYTLGKRKREQGLAPATPSTPPPEPEPPREAANPLLDALPAEIGSDVLALEMEDHYVRVHTALGSELVLMRLRDAMAHLSEVEGRQVHRSWWVARGAVEDVKRDGRNVRLVLARGLEAPVSRAMVSDLKEAGWL
ncbi:MAG: LytTR family DNA-binding domain-containing protein [Erythrobacter sp.]|uniref:LytTR family DNA-binding domain-containing protein n=1 Tax=Erythrobacter sp. TaxID=1042 RepID=UPI003C730320